MRKWILRATVLFCTALLLTTGVSAAVSASDTAYAVEGGNIYFNTSKGNITGADADITAAAIPAEIDGVAVTTIDARAFENCTKLTQVTIPDGVTTLGEYMLKGTAVTEITIPSTVTKSTGYWNGALAGSNRLTKVAFAPGTTAIPASICASDNFISAIDEVVIPSGVKSIGAKAFYDCTMLKTLQLPDSVTTIASDAFSGMDLEAVYIPCEDSDVAITLIDMEVPFIASRLA